MSDDATLILGAGPAGLAFAQQHGPGCIVLEKDEAPGGLCRSIAMGGGVFDLGGHSFHTPHAEIDQLVRGLMGDNWHDQQRDARVWAGDMLIGYPFQHHFAQLPDARIVAECEGHIHDAERVAGSPHFEAWIHNRFGRGIAEHFMLPYNRKLWARDLRTMAFDWVGQRVATSNPPAGSMGGSKDRAPLLASSRVGYPREGGFGAIFSAMAKRCDRIEYGQEVASIDSARKQITTKRGDVWPFRSIVSTIPLPILLRSLAECPASLVQTAARLEAVSLKIVMLLVCLRRADIPQRIYVAGPDVPAHKIAFNHMSSPELAALPHHAVMAEVSYSPTKAAPADGELIDTMTRWLTVRGFITDAADLISSRVVDLPLGYPVNTHDRVRNVREIKDYLRTLDIHSIGRFGAWDYANSDECMRQGIALARDAFAVARP